MENALHIRTSVSPDKRIEIPVPDFDAGTQIDVFLVPSQDPAPSAQSVLEYLESLPPGPRLSDSWEEIGESLRAERESWSGVEASASLRMAT
jgi:hypothetical protein